MEEKNNHKELLYHTRSEDAQEIIGRKLPWMVRWGIIIIAIIILFVYLIIRFVKWNDLTLFQRLFT